MLHKHAGPAVAGNYLIGAIAGALVTGFGLLLLGGLLSPLPDRIGAIAATCALALLTLRVTGVLCLDLPQRQVQIARETFNQAPPAAARRFAFELGMGVRTYITATAPYALVVLLVLGAPQTTGAVLAAGAVAALGYGLGRSLVVASQSLLQRPAIEHPRWALRAADILAVAAALALVVQKLLQA